MCEHCQNNMIGIEEPLLDLLIAKSGIKPEDLHDLITKAEQDKFKLDRTKGEGTPSKEEIKYNESIKNLYKPIDKLITELKDNKTTTDNWIKQFNKACDEFLPQAEQIIDEELPTIYQAKREIGLKKLKKLDIKPTENKQDPEILNSLLQWQKHSMKKRIETLRLNVQDRIYGKNYFVTTYAKS